MIIFKVILLKLFEVLGLSFENCYDINLKFLVPFWFCDSKVYTCQTSEFGYNPTFLPIFSRVSSECLAWDTWSSAASEFPLHLGICLHSHPGYFLSSTIKKTSNLELFWALLLAYTR